MMMMRQVQRTAELQTAALRYHAGLALAAGARWRHTSRDVTVIFILSFISRWTQSQPEIQQDFAMDA